MKENIKQIFTILNRWKNKLLAIIKEYLKVFKKNILFYSLVSVLLISGTVCLHLGESRTFSGREEFFYDKVSEIARNSEDDVVVMDIKPNHFNRELYKDVYNNYSTNFLYEINSSAKNNFVYQIVYKDYLTVNEINGKSSLMFPNVFSSKEVLINTNNQELKRFKMDVMNLYYFNQPVYDYSLANQFCVISSNYALILQKDRNLEKIDDIIGEIITISFQSEEKLKKMNFYISAIYDSNLGDADLFERIYGNTILSWFFNYNFDDTIVDDISYSINLHHDYLCNKKTFHYFNEFYDLDNSDYRFYSGNNFIEDKNLYDSYCELLDNRNFEKINFLIIISLGTFLLLVGLIVYYVLIKNRLCFNDDRKLLSILVAITMILLGVNEIVLSKINLIRMQSYGLCCGIYNSLASISSLLIIPIIFAIFTIKIIFKTKEGEENV